MCIEEKSNIKCNAVRSYASITVSDFSKTVEVNMHEKRFNREIERLRDPERLKRLEVNRVVDLAKAGLARNSSVLDIGTGSGVFAEAFAKQGVKVSGIDANPEMLPVASTYIPAGTFEEGIAEDLPYSDDSFDLVFMGLLLHETDDPQKAVNEAFRVTRRRLSILEWRKEEQPFGPPLGDRLSEQQIAAFGHEAGFKEITINKLRDLVLYCLEK
jgi:ubiquinone/menaquinone biosynthesis C-methylase UbiE